MASNIKGKRVIVYDASVADFVLSKSWRLWSAYLKKRGIADIVVAAWSWKSAANGIAAAGPVREVQFWGHGSPGCVYMNGQALSNLRHTKHIDKIAKTLNNESIVWFRTCSTFCGSDGRAFMSDMAFAFQCIVAAHTHIIGPFQSGLHAVRAGQQMSWDLHEGMQDIEEKPEGENLLVSMPFSPNTITCLHSRIPERFLAGTMVKK